MIQGQALIDCDCIQLLWTRSSKTSSCWQAKLTKVWILSWVLQSMGHPPSANHNEVGEISQYRWLQQTITAPGMGFVTDCEKKQKRVLQLVGPMIWKNKKEWKKKKFAQLSYMGLQSTNPWSKILDPFPLENFCTVFKFCHWKSKILWYWRYHLQKQVAFKHAVTCNNITKSNLQRNDKNYYFNYN